MSGVPLRSPLGVPYRSTLNALARSGTFPLPPGSADVPCAAMIREKCEKPTDCPPLPFPCDTLQTLDPTVDINACDAEDPRYPFSGCFSYAITLFGLKRYVSKADFPLYLLDAGGAVIYQIPDSICVSWQWEDHFSILSNDLAVGNIIDSNDPFPGTGPTQGLIGAQHTFYLVSKTAISLPTVGTLLGYRHNCVAECLLGAWESCFNYTVVKEGPLSSYVARILGTGFNALDSLLRFSGTGNGGQYDGDHQVIYRSDTELRAVSLLWAGNASGGTWKNGNAIFICDAEAPEGTTNGEVINSSVPAYNGFHDFRRAGGGPGAYRWVTDNLWEVGTATGQIVISGGPSGIQIAATGPLEVVNIPPPNFKLRVTGTTSYNGDYNCGAISPGSGAWIFSGGELDGVQFVGSETGAWLDIDNPARNGAIIGVQDAGLGSQTVNFSAVEPERSGTISEVRSSAMTVMAAGHDGVAGGRAYLFSTAPTPPYDQQPRDIVGIRVDELDVDSIFTVTDAGRVTIGAP